MFFPSLVYKYKSLDHIATILSYLIGKILYSEICRDTVFKLGIVLLACN